MPRSTRYASLPAASRLTDPPAPPLREPPCPANAWHAAHRTSPPPGSPPLIPKTASHGAHSARLKPSAKATAGRSPSGITPRQRTSCSQLLPPPPQVLTPGPFLNTASAFRATTAPAPCAASASSPASTSSAGARLSPKPGTLCTAAPSSRCAPPCARTALNAGWRSESLTKPRS